MAMSYASYNTVDQYSSPSVGSSDLPIDMAEGNEANVDLIGLECDAGKDVTKEVEEVEVDCEPYKKKQRKKSSIIWQEMTLVKLENGEERVQCNHCNYKLKSKRMSTRGVAARTKSKLKFFIFLKHPQRGGGETGPFPLPEVEVETEWRQILAVWHDSYKVLGSFSDGD
nr:zinc finger BED domain-containing protein RICESLEEPER 2-like [Ipomoea batatas]